MLYLYKSNIIKIQDSLNLCMGYVFGMAQYWWWTIVFFLSFFFSYAIAFLVVGSSFFFFFSLFLSWLFMSKVFWGHGDLLYLIYAVCNVTFATESCKVCERNSSKLEILYELYTGHAMSSFGWEGVKIFCNRSSICCD